MNARELSVRAMQESIQAEPYAIARAQLVRQLERDAEKERMDAITYQKWVARQPAIRAQIEKERKAIAAGFAASLVIGAVVFAAVIAFLMAYGLALGVAFLLALAAGGSTSGCCTIIHIRH